MGFYSINFTLNCSTDDGIPLSGLDFQEMDAFIGYPPHDGARDDEPPSHLMVGADMVLRDGFTNEPFSVKGYEANETEPSANSPFGVVRVLMVVEGSSVKSITLIDEETNPKFVQAHTIIEPQ